MRWKMAAIAPVPKKAMPSLNDLRPISLLPLPAKLLEKVVLKSMKSTFISKYEDYQFGFRPNSSTQCALISLHDRMTAILDDEAAYGAMIIAYDYSRAFDKLRFELIINRLLTSKFPYDFVLWIYNYISGRYQQTKIGINCSRPVAVTSGVPQGSILGPYLYAVTTCTFAKSCPESHIVKFADDTSICFPLYKNCANVHVLQEHENMLEWSKEMCLEVNTTKCKSLTICKRGKYHPIDIDGVQQTESLKLLGVWFDVHGSWSTHITSVVKTSSRRLFALRTLKPFLTKFQLKTVYFLLVRSLMEYCAPVFVGVNTTDSNRLDRVQKRFHRILCGPECDLECLPSLAQRRNVLSMKFLMKVVNESHLLKFILPPMSTSGRFLLPFRRSSKRSGSYFLYACEHYNLHFTRTKNCTCSLCNF